MWLRRTGGGNVTNHAGRLPARSSQRYLAPWAYHRARLRAVRGSGGTHRFVADRAQIPGGRPWTVPWAVPISPANRIAGSQDFNTFQPLFLYEVLWDLVVGFALIYLIRKMSLTGDRALAVCIGGYAIGMLGTESFVLAGPHVGLLVKQLPVGALLAATAPYPYLPRAKLSPQ